MIIRYDDFINEGFFDFFKKKTRNDIAYQPIESQPLILGEYIRLHPEIKNINLVSIYQIQAKAYEHYINTKLIGKRIKIPYGNKVIKKYDKITTRGLEFEGKVVNNPFKIKEEFVIYLERCNLVEIFRKYILSLYDNRNNEYLVNVNDFQNSRLEEKVNRIITSEDPFGEENWNE